MAATKNYHTGNGSTTEYSFTFPYLNLSDIKVKLDGVTTTAYTLKPTNNPTIVNFTSAPANNVPILIYRDTGVATANTVHAAGSAITATSLNNNQTQTLYALEELENSIEKGDIYNYANASHSNGSSAPTSPNEGDTWFDTVSGRSYIYYTDTDTSQWVETSPTNDPSAAPTVHNSDVTFLGDDYDVVWDKSDNAFEFEDNAKAKFGTGSDLLIYHDGSHSYIAEDSSGSGNLYIQSDANIILQNNDALGGGSADVFAKFTSGGSCEFYHNNVKKLETSSSGATLSGTLVADNLDIGTNVDIDGTCEADAYTVDGTALNEYIADTVGAMVTGNTETDITVTYDDADNTLDFVIGAISGTADVATHVTIVDNESTNEDNLIAFVEDATGAGNRGLETDGDFHYNPSTGTVSATIFKGDIDANDGDFDGTLEADAITIGGTALNTVIAGVTVTDATNAAHVSVADNESTNENNLVPFIEDASATGNVGLESDGNFYYNPSTGTVTATAFAGDITGACTGTATNATHVTVADNESTDENNLITFIEDTSATGNVGLESDGDFHYNPSSGTVTATIFKGDIDANDGDFDGTLEADAITVGGTALNTVIAGVTVTNATNATNATHVSVADNESTNEDNLIAFIEDASATGNVGLESDGDFHYNPSTGTVSATIFKGDVDANDGDFDGTLEADAITVGGTALNTVIAGVTVTNATNAAHVSVADNESTNENNLITFIEDASATGNVGLESDGDFHYNPSTGTVTATAFTGNLTGNVTGNASGTAATVTGAAQSAITSTGTLTGLTVTGDVFFDNGADAGKDILWDVSNDALDFADNVKARFGTGGDLEIFHDGTNSYLKDNGTGSIILASNSWIYWMNEAADETIIKAGANSQVELYYDDVLKLETTAIGVTVHDPARVDAPGVLKVDSGTGAADQVYIGFTYGGSDTAGGGIRRDGTSAGCELYSGSDRRIKKDIVDMPPTLSKINQVKLKSFGYKDELTGCGVGPIAQDLINVFPKKVTNTDDGTGDTVPDDVQPWTIGTNFTWELMKAVQELSAEVETLKTKVATLEGG